jgi:hypothetical protein
MNENLTTLLEKIKQLEHELVAEIRAGQEKFGYEIREGKVHFKEAVRQRHRKLAKSLVRYFRDAKILSMIMAPVI